MEDEHICIDNIEEHIGEVADVSLPASFYGVRFYSSIYHINTRCFVPKQDVYKNLYFRITMTKKFVRNHGFMWTGL